MSRRLLVACALALALKMLAITGSAKEIASFRPLVDKSLTGGIISNLFVLVLFAEIYWQIDQDDTETHFGFESVLDAYYFSTVTSSSVGFGDYLPKTKKAKVLTMVHIMSMFFVMLPVVLKALETGN